MSVDLQLRNAKNCDRVINIVVLLHCVSTSSTVFNNLIQSALIFFFFHPSSTLRCHGKKETHTEGRA